MTDATVSIDRIVIRTSGVAPDLRVDGASIPEAQLSQLLAVHRVLLVQNQNGLRLDLYFDMDEETLIASPSEDKPSGTN